MVFNAKEDIQCQTCSSYKYNAPSYIWKSILTESKLILCQSCAIRETFGTKYSQNKKYKQWKERNQNG
jgi:hypothetical protein